MYTNPFVKAALVIIDTAQTDEESISPESLATRIGEAEPMLSKLNCACVAREALCQWPAREAARKAERELIAAAEAERELIAAE